MTMRCHADAILISSVRKEKVDGDL